MSPQPRQEHMPLSRTRHCTTCNTLRYNDCKVGCAADDAGNEHNWTSLELGRQKVDQRLTHAAKTQCTTCTKYGCKQATNTNQ